jgi:ABC-type multidrug transport system fused ATPase/permease subunit
MNIKKKFLFILNSKEKKSFIILAFLMLIAAVIEVLSVSLIIPAVSILIDITNIDKIKIFLSPYLSLKIKNLIDEYFIFVFIIFSLSVFVLKFIYMNLLIYIKMSYVSNIVIRLSGTLYESYLLRPYKFHLNNSSSKLILNITSEIQNFASNLLSPFLEILIELIIMLGLLGLLFFSEPRGSLLIIFISLISAYLFHNYTHLKTVARGKERRINEILALKLIQQGLAGIKELIIYSKSIFFIKEYLKYNSILFNSMKKQQTLVDTSKYFIELIAIFSVMLLIFFLINFNNSNLIIIKLSLFAVIFFKILPSLNRIIGAKQRIVFALVTIDKIYEEIKYFNTFKSIKKNNNDKKITFDKKIELKNISYSYSMNNKIIKNLNLTIRKGEAIGIVGPSGSGKSTLINILTGLLKSDHGKILIDSVALNNKAEIESWQKKIGYVPQNFFMLEDSIRSNIVFHPNYVSKNNDKKIYECLKKAQILSFVESLPKKLGTLIGERGSQISVGQAQRFSIARALYKNHDILILDEATSALDIKNQKNILNILKRLKREKTLIIITHHKYMLSICDNVYKIFNKKIYKN